MKKNIRGQLIMLSKRLLYGFILQLIFCTVLLANTGNAQRKNIEKIRVELSVEDTPLEKVFANIEKQTGLEFTYNSANVDVKQKVDVKASNKTVYNLLMELSTETGLRFIQINDNIHVKPHQPGLSKSIVIEEITLVDVTGKVVDESGQAMPGVTIIVEGTTKGAVTDLDGKYEISAEIGDILVFSFIGFTQQKITINNQSTIDVILKEDEDTLDEIIVIGYGTQKKGDITGSVSSLNSEQIKQVKVLSPDQALQGKVPGVDVTQTSGQPGASSRIRIRGGNSISAGNEPLYVIDGFPIYNDNSATSTGAGRSPSINALATINPADIESIDVLKDASATAIYGSRGANGVVLITTKRGKIGVSKVSFESSFGIQKVRNTIPMLNASEYASFENEVFLYQRDVLGQSNRVPVYTQEQILSLGEGTNWQNEIFRTAPVQDYQISFTGGDEKVKYALVGGYTDQEGIIINSDFKRYSLRLNLDLSVTPRFRIGNSSTLSRTTSNLAFTGAAAGIQGSSTGLVGVAIHFNPITPVRDLVSGEYTFQDQNVGEVSGADNRSVPYYNPVALAELATNESRTFRALNNIFGEFDILENLTFRTTIGADYLSTKQNSYIPSTVRLGAFVGGSAIIAQVETFTWLSENTFNYRLESGDHSFNILAGFTAQASRAERFQIEDAGFVNDILAEYNIGTGSVNPARTPPGASEWGLLSYIGRGNYILKEKYLFTATARYDGSSRFGEGNKWGFFPSAAFAWKISEEQFIKNISAISQLKLRSSYGLTGNQEIGIYQSIAQMATGIYTINDNSVAGFSPIRVANPNLKWETTAQFDVGVDIGLFNDRLSITADYYLKNTNDLLLNVQIPSSSGFTSSLQNIGAVKNEGFELGINTLLLDKEVKWDVSLNFATNKNTVTDLGDESQRLIYSGWNVMKGQPASILEVGKPIGSFIGWKTNGWFLTDEEALAAPNQTAADQNPLQLGGNIRYVDINNDNVVDDKDRTLIGNALPNLTGGFSTTLSYKGFQLSSSWSFSLGNEIMNFNKLENNFGIGRYNASKNFNNRWSYMNTEEENRNATAPTVLDSRNLFSVIDYWVEDASYLRMRNITLTYSLPLEFTDAQIYVAGQNLITFTEYTGFDPEVNLAEQNNLLLGYDYGAYPASKSYIIGLKFNF